MAFDTISLLVASPSVTEFVKTFVNKYKLLSKVYKIFYYFSRTITALCAAILPFIVGNPEMVKLSTFSSVAIALIVALDFVFNPKENWIKYSNAYHELEIKGIQKKAKSKEEVEALILISKVENGKEDLRDLEEIKKKFQTS